ncbi:MAG TPA: glycosyltransferase [Hyphomicrobium sp.]
MTAFKRLDAHGGKAAAPLIALALPCVGYGGAEAVNLALGREFINCGFKVDFVTMGEVAETEALIPDEARHVCLAVPKMRGVLIPMIRYFRTARPDAMIASIWPFTTICVAAHQLSGSQTRVIVWEHNTLSIQYANRGLVHDVLLKGSIAYETSRAHASVSVSNGVADDLAALSGLSRSKFSVIHNPMLSREFLKSDDAAAEAIWGGWRGPRLITVGRFKKQKNHPLLIRAFKELLTIRDARLLVLGDGDLLDAIRRLAAHEAISDKVLIPGPTLNPSPYYRSADLFVLSSDHEGLPTVLLEALAFGLPIVSTDCRSGPAEILENGRYGRLVPVGDAAALTQAMLESLDATHDRDALMRRAQDFSPDRIADQYLRLLFPHASADTSV